MARFDIDLGSSKTREPLPRLGEPGIKGFASPVRGPLAHLDRREEDLVGVGGVRHLMGQPDRDVPHQRAPSR